ncbi:MAG: B12-binding domain-containing protein [Methanomassiliicoccales archaeon]
MEKAILEMDRNKAATIAKSIVGEGGDLASVVEEGLVQAMKEVADSYDRRDIFLPQVLATVNAFYAALNELHPLKKGEPPAHAKILIGVVEGDMHDIGKNLVKVLLDANGYSCSDLGKNVPSETFLARAQEVVPEYLAMSTLMTPTLAGIHEIISGLEASGIRKKMTVMIGGGPVTQGFAERIGADFYGAQAMDAVRYLREKEGRA